MDQSRVEMQGTLSCTASDGSADVAATEGKVVTSKDATPAKPPSNAPALADSDDRESPPGDKEGPRVDPKPTESPTVKSPTDVSASGASLPPPKENVLQSVQNGPNGSQEVREAAAPFSDQVNTNPNPTASQLAKPTINKGRKK